MDSKIFKEKIWDIQKCPSCQKFLVEENGSKECCNIGVYNHSHIFMYDWLILRTVFIDTNKFTIYFECMDNEYEENEIIEVYNDYYLNKKIKFTDDILKYITEYDDDKVIKFIRNIMLLC